MQYKIAHKINGMMTPVAPKKMKKGELLLGIDWVPESDGPAVLLITELIVIPSSA